MNKNFLSLVSLLITFTTVKAQSDLLLLKDVVRKAQVQSPAYFRARNMALNHMYSYNVYKAGLLPRFQLEGVVTDYSKAISKVQQPDGTNDFRNSEQNSSSVGLSATQNIGLTGGTLTLNSSWLRNDVFNPESRLNYYSVPFSVRYNQPVLLYNRYKWENKIQPLLYEESRRQYVEDMESVALQTNSLYFNALTAQIELGIAKINVANTDTLYKIARGRYEIGKIAENDLLQMELGYLNAQNSLEQLKLKLEITYQELKRFLDLPVSKEIELNIPDKVPQIQVPVEKALSEAKENRQSVLSFRRKRLEAERDIAEARSENGFNINLAANIGKSQQSTDLNNLYRNSLPQQNLQIGISVPLLDWGQTKSRIKQAKANKELIEVDVKQEETNFDQEIYLQVMQFNMQNKQLLIAAKADTIAEKRYEVTKQRYYIGKISITELNLAQTEKDQAKQLFINALRVYWNSYFTIRRLTLYDFEENKKINFQLKEN
ncbi:TolC family protein [Solitalea koreensis]|uniref:Outer membrane efflux protein n=1 Tax=Solitalea koreensis TaxID=543615 RepID=A0A521BJR0_9SPHI|nr:TolC family protein [Solitalea koreensis]SMO47388.1 Outer membrane efflux protein [Solitalea koreensis]